MALAIRTLMPLLPPVKAAVTATSAAAVTSTLKQGEIIEVLADAFTWINFGAAATNAMYPIPPNVPILLKVPTRSSGVNSTYPGQETPTAADQSQIWAITGTTSNLYITKFGEN